MTKPALPYPNHPRKRGVHYRTVNLDASVDAMLVRIAKYEGKNVSWIVRKVLDEYVARWKSRHEELPL